MNHLETLNEYIESYFNGNKTDREARLAFQGYRDEVLTSIPSMNAEFIKEQPACIAMGFLGKLDFTEGPHLNAFIKKPGPETLTGLRKNGAVRVADSALEAWRHLIAMDQASACMVLELCISTRKNKHVAAIKSTKSASAQSSPSLN